MLEDWDSPVSLHSKCVCCQGDVIAMTCDQVADNVSPVTYSDSCSANNNRLFLSYQERQNPSKILLFLVTSLDRHISFTYISFIFCCCFTYYPFIISPPVVDQVFDIAGHLRRKWVSWHNTRHNYLCVWMLLHLLLHCCQITAISKYYIYMIFLEKSKDLILD